MILELLADGRIHLSAELRCAAHNRYEAEQCFGLFVREIAESYMAR